jgi:hypothetical protein
MINAEDLVTLLERLRREVSGRTVIGADGVPIRRSQVVREFSGPTTSLAQ